MRIARIVESTIHNNHVKRVLERDNIDKHAQRERKRERERNREREKDKERDNRTIMAGMFPQGSI
jgi:hypothetical protein